MLFLLKNVTILTVKKFGNLLYQIKIMVKITNISHMSVIIGSFSKPYFILNLLMPINSSELL